MIANLEKSDYEVVANNLGFSQDNDFVKIAKMSFPKYDGSKDPVMVQLIWENFLFT